MKKRFLSLVLAMLMVMSVMAGCSSQETTTATTATTTTAEPEQTTETTAPEATTTETTSEAAETGETVYRIGISTQAWKHEFLKNMVNALQAVDAEMDNVELIIVDSEDSIEKQLNDVDTLIAQEVDGIILNALSLEGSSPAVVACNDAGIPVVELVSYTENTGYETFVGTDVKASGIIAGNLAAELIGESGAVFELQGIIGHTAQINRGAGIAEALAEYPDITIVESQCGEFSKDQSMSVVETWLTRYPEGEIDAIVAHNDSMALGAMNACIAAGRSEIEIIGIDGDAEALQGVIAGTMGATVLDYCEYEAELAVEEMVSILSGNAPKGEILAEYIPISDVETAQEFLDMRS